MLDKDVTGHVFSTIGVKIYTCGAGREILMQKQQAKMSKPLWTMFG